MIEKKSGPSAVWDIYHDTDDPAAPLMGWEYEMNGGPDPEYMGPDWRNSSDDEYRSPVGPLSFHRRIAVPYFMEAVPEFDYGDSDEQDCGIHVHIQADHLDYDHVYTFLHNRRHHKFFLELSGRLEDAFRQWTRQHGWMDWRSEENRYNRGIIAHRGKTHEFRLFHALPDLLMIALECADSLMRMPRAKITPQSWLDFMRGNPQRYQVAPSRIARCLHQIAAAA
ncbi:MAG TPA: hypothetical protein VD994_11525 [Prosthecobacter sp.]|nr:hypothetical protein [Prosthecobacter sp.]